MNSKVLLVEDEEHIGNGIVFNLEQEGHEVVWCKTGEDGLKQWSDFNPHTIVLDIMLPGMSGLEVLSKIRETDKTTPILILSAKDQDRDKIKGLRLGCDDYLAKPFNLEELLLRVDKMIQRSPEKVQDEFIIGDFKVSKQTLTATKGETEIQLTTQELKILEIFVENRGQIVSREKLLREALGYQESVESRAVDNFIVRLRKYFEIDPKNPKLIKSVRGAGYIYS